MKLRKARIEAKNYWLAGTGRTLVNHRGVITDEFEGSLECKWQQMARGVKNESWHVCVFCSVGNSASAITDVLLDKRYDNLSFAKEEDCEIIFRYYQRLFRTVLEVLDDLEQIAARNKDGVGFVGKNKARTALSGKFKPFAEFANTVCKHQIGYKSYALHKHNHHIPKLFAEYHKGSEYSQLLCLDCRPSETQTAEAVLMPSLVYVLSIVMESYYELTDLMQADHDAFKRFCEAYGSD